MGEKVNSATSYTHTKEKFVSRSGLKSKLMYFPCSPIEGIIVCGILNNRKFPTRPWKSLFHSFLQRIKKFNRLPGLSNGQGQKSNESIDMIFINFAPLPSISTTLI